MYYTYLNACSCFDVESLDSFQNSADVIKRRNDWSWFCSARCQLTPGVTETMTSFQKTIPNIAYIDRDCLRIFQIPEPSWDSNLPMLYLYQRNLNASLQLARLSTRSRQSYQCNCKCELFYGYCLRALVDFVPRLWVDCKATGRDARPSNYLEREFGTL